MALLPNSNWSRASVLRRLSNPTREAYEQKIHIPELTFVGTANQPDFGEVLLTFYPAAWTVELKSLKQYKDEFRNTVASYERLANVMFEDLMKVYEPQRLRLLMRLRPRGGISLLPHDRQRLEDPRWPRRVHGLGRQHRPVRLRGPRLDSPLW